MSTRMYAITIPKKRLGELHLVLRSRAEREMGGFIEAYQQKHGDSPTADPVQQIMKDRYGCTRSERCMYELQLFDVWPRRIINKVWLVRPLSMGYVLLNWCMQAREQYPHMGIEDHSFDGRSMSEQDHPALSELADVVDHMIAERWYYSVPVLDREDLTAKLYNFGGGG